MNALNKLMGGTVLGLVLAAGLAAPSYADKLSHTDKNPSPTASANAGDIDFGDDSSEWAKDGECDDPRFSGSGSAAELVEADKGKDATDCRAAYEAGKVTFSADAPAAIANTSAPAIIDFGDDSSEWAKDGECDDPRFTGAGAATDMLESDIGHDATDCKAAHEAGTITLKDDAASSTANQPAFTADDIDFGDDSSKWAKDGECDDPRFTGTGSAEELLDEDTSKDATDCRAAYEAGTIALVEGGEIPAAAIDYGDDTSEWAKDDECDDPRFSGPGVARTLLEDDKGHDATDCRNAVTTGEATYNGVDTSESATAVDASVFDYGSDFSQWANDGECDDPRFAGTGTNKKLLADDMYGDATDCKALEADGKVNIRTVYTPDYAAAAPHDSSQIKFGSNASDYANDGQCDDPRFRGPGAAGTLLEGDRERDAADCKAAYEAGTIVLLEDY